MNVAWLLENDILPDLHGRLRFSAEELGHTVLPWEDFWASSWPSFDDSFVLFHGNLETAAMIAEKSPWHPGAFCNVDAFACTHWYPQADKWRLQREWLPLTVQEFVDDPESAFKHFDSPGALFVRPDSPLKPFAGRVVARKEVSLAALDHGFYYDDTSLRIVLAPVKAIVQEWRFVVVHGEVVTGSAYSAGTRSGAECDPGGEPWIFAEEVATNLPAPEAAYVLDVCESEGRLRLLELNPISGADLYACDTHAVSAAIGRLANKM